MSPTKFFLYARKSTDTEDRQVYSIDHQIAELRELACRKNLEIVAELTEHRTAKAPGRPIFNDMLARIKKGEASGILSWSPDRLARNSVDGGLIIHYLDLGLLLDLQFPTHTFERTSAGKLMLSVLFGMSKYYTDSLADGIKRAIRQRIQHGYWPRRAPLGYLFEHNTRTVIPDPQRAPLIRKTFELYASGTYSLERLTDAINAAGLRTLATKRHPAHLLYLSQYHRLLTNTFYTGLMKLKGESYAGKHEPLIPHNLFNTCQGILNQRRRGRKPPKLLPFLYRGLFTCADCDCTITSETHKGHTYLHCTKRRGSCSQSYVREERITEQIALILKRLIVPQDVADWMIAQWQYMQQNDAAQGQKQLRDTQHARDAIDAKLERLTGAFVDGAIALDEYKRTKEKLLKQQGQLADKLRFLTNNQTSRFEPAIRFIRGSTSARIVAHGDDRVAQRDFFQKTGSNLRVGRGRVLWEGRGAWKHVADARFSAAPVHRSRVSVTAATGDRPVWSTELASVRPLFESLTAWFTDNPSP